MLDPVLIFSPTVDRSSKTEDDNLVERPLRLSTGAWNAAVLVTAANSEAKIDSCLMVNIIKLFLVEYTIVQLWEQCTSPFSLGYTETVLFPISSNTVVAITGKLKIKRWLQGMLASVVGDLIVVG